MSSTRAKRRLIRELEFRWDLISAGRRYELITRGLLLRRLLFTLNAETLLRDRLVAVRLHDHVGQPQIFLAFLISHLRLRLAVPLDWHLRRLLKLVNHVVVLFEQRGRVDFCW